MVDIFYQGGGDGTSNSNWKCHIQAFCRIIQRRKYVLSQTSHSDEEEAEKKTMIHRRCWLLIINFSHRTGSENK